MKPFEWLSHGVFVLWFDGGAEVILPLEVHLVRPLSDPGDLVPASPFWSMLPGMSDTVKSILCIPLLKVLSTLEISLRPWFMVCLQELG